MEFFPWASTLSPLHQWLSPLAAQWIQLRRFLTPLNWTPFRNWTTILERWGEGVGWLFCFVLSYPSDSNCALRDESHTTPPPLKISSPWRAMLPNIGCWVDLPGKIVFFRKIPLPMPYLRSMKKTLKSGGPYRGRAENHWQEIQVSWILNSY